MALKSLIHKGKFILRVDFSECKTENEMLDNLEKLVHTLLALPAKVPILCNFASSTITTGFMNSLKILGKKSEDKIRKVAVIGVSGLKNIFVQAYINFTGQDVRTFEHEAEALNWLVN